MEEKIQIAIDGPAGAGKSTVAKALAKRLGILYLDTGAMYRSIAYKALRQKINIDNEEEISKLAQNTDIEFDHSEESRVYCDGEDVTKEIRSPDVSRVVSIIATYPDVRKRLVELQRREGERGSIVMDGRDIGTYVLPQADLKIFLTASVSERAKRRYEELKLTGKNVSLEEVLEDVEKRDQRDRDREVSPLKPAPDAWILDTSNLTVDEIIEKILARLGKIRG